MSLISRKKFISSLGAATCILAVPQAITSQNQPAAKQPALPQLDKELVRNFVGFAHKDFEKVKAMFAETPDLLNAVHNLGGWDWEDAIGAAGHVGHREMTLFLLEQGARPTICTAAMLGQLDVVKAYLTAYPAMKTAVGPHKISLLRHAKAGKEFGAPVVGYLASIGITA